MGWSAYTKDPDTLAAALAGSTLLAVARDGEDLVGLVGLVEFVLAPYAHVRQNALLTDTERARKLSTNRPGGSATADDSVITRA